MCVCCTDDATAEDLALELPTCLHGDELNAMGYDVSVRVFLVYGVGHQMLKIAKELRKNDVRQQMTPGREIHVRKEIREKMYDKPLKIMDTGPGITKQVGEEAITHSLTHETTTRVLKALALSLSPDEQGPSFAPRLLRYLFHDALDFNNVVLYNGTHAVFPEDTSDELMVDSYLTSRNRQTGQTLVNKKAKAGKQVKFGGLDGCALDPMEMALGEDMAMKVGKAIREEKEREHNSTGEVVTAIDTARLLDIRCPGATRLAAQVSGRGLSASQHRPEHWSGDHPRTSLQRRYVHSQGGPSADFGARLYDPRHGSRYDIKRGAAGVVMVKSVWNCNGDNKALFFSLSLSLVPAQAWNSFSCLPPCPSPTGAATDGV